MTMNFTMTAQAMAMDLTGFAGMHCTIVLVGFFLRVTNFFFYNVFPRFKRDIVQIRWLLHGNTMF